MGSDQTDFEKSYDAHAALVGHVTLAWSNVHYLVFEIFRMLAGMEDRCAGAVFFALKSDASQRDITLALIKERVSDETQRKAGSLFGRISGLAGERNLAAHTMWVEKMPDGKIVPNPSIRHPPQLREDFKAQFENLAERLRDLFRELLGLREAIMKEWEGPPRK